MAPYFTILLYLCQFTTTTTGWSRNHRKSNKCQLFYEVPKRLRFAGILNDDFTTHLLLSFKSK